MSSQYLKKVIEKRYQPTPSHRNQKLCRHSMAYRTRTNNTCTICGSMKYEGHWWYLTEREYYIFVDGKAPK